MLINDNWAEGGQWREEPPKPYKYVAYEEWYDDEPLRCELDVENGVCLSILRNDETCPRSDRHLEP